MTPERLRDFRDDLAVKLSRFTDELDDYLSVQNWKAIRSFFGNAETPEDRGIKTILWGKTFMSKYFRDDTPDFHYELAYKFFSRENEYDAAPRGFAKTTLDQACIAISCAYSWENFIVYIEKTFTEASEVLASVRTEFVENKRILTTYGTLVGKRRDGTVPDKVKDAEGDLFINGVRLRAKGFDTTVRGLKDNENRPSLIILGDVEQDRRIRSGDQRRFYMENYTQGVIPAVDLGGRVKVRGTILHQDSLLANLIRQHKGEIYSAFDPALNIDADRADIERTLLWPTRWTYDQLKKKYDEMLLEGLGSSKFSQEYLNVVLDDSSRYFQWDWLQKTFSPADINLRTVNRFVCFDVAESKNQGTDWTFKTSVDWDADNNWFVQSAIRRHVNSPEFVDWIFEVWINEKPQCIGVEQSAFDSQVKPWLEQKSEQTGVYPIVVALDHGGRAKEDRVKGALQGRLQHGKILFKQGATDHTSILRGELYDFPRGKNDDGPDSLAYIQQIGARPFSANKEQPTTMQDEIDQFLNSKRKSPARRI